MKIDINRAFTDAFGIFKGNIALLVIAVVATALIGVVSCGIAASAAVIGFFAICLRLVDADETKPSAGDILKYINVSSILTGLVIVLLGAAGNLLCCIGGLVTQPIAVLALMRAADRSETNGLGLFSEMFNFVTKGGWMFLLYVYLSFIVASLGSALCGIGVLATYPLGMLVLACVYRQAFPKA